MKKVLLSFFATATVAICSQTGFAQPSTVPDQNPDYEIARAKYMQVADSLNKWHSSTQHQMYKAIDWLADRAEARADRREFRRQIRLERAGDYNADFYYNGYYRGNYNRYRYHPYRGYGHFGFTPFYRVRFW